MSLAVVHSRAEDFHPTTPFDCILSRAYASLSLFIETTQHALSPTGELIAMKGKHPEDELADLPKGWTAAPAIPLHMKGMSIERHLVHLNLSI